MKHASKSELFLNLFLVFGGSAVIVSLWYGSVIPLIVAGVSLFGILSFINGLK